MNDFDFTIPPQRSNYDAKLALKSFESAGTMKNVAAGQTIFTENEKANPLLLQRDRMYFLLDGQVDLSIGKAPVGTVHNGEIFGEMTVITGMPRAATATAKTGCRLITLDKGQLQSALQASPEFGLLLMSVMIARLRDTLARHANVEPHGEALKDVAIFDRRLLDKLADQLGDSARVRYPAGKVIMQEGQAGVLMYVVMEGAVDIAIQNSVVGRVGPGGMFGEMALITRRERLASAIARTDCVLLTLNRNVFLDLVSDNPKFAIALLGAVGDRARFVASPRA